MAYAHDILRGVAMVATATRGFDVGMSRLGMPSIAAARLRSAIVDHSDVILRIALLSGAFVGYALSGIAA
jgi:hypothetical protein